jgi:hypothetical protein
MGIEKGNGSSEKPFVWDNVALKRQNAIQGELIKRWSAKPGQLNLDVSKDIADIKDRYAKRWVPENKLPKPIPSDEEIKTAIMKVNWIAAYGKKFADLIEPDPPRWLFAPLADFEKEIYKTEPVPQAAAQEVATRRSIRTAVDWVTRFIMRVRKGP